MRFLVAGAHALAVHGVPRATGGLDVWIDRDPANAERVWRAIVSFGAPVESLDMSAADLTRPDTLVQIGLPPRRLDLLTDLTDVTDVGFEHAWNDRVVHSVADVDVPFLGRRPPRTPPPSEG